MPRNRKGKTKRNSPPTTAPKVSMRKLQLKPTIDLKLAERRDTFSDSDLTSTDSRNDQKRRESEVNLLRPTIELIRPPVPRDSFFELDRRNSLHDPNDSRSNPNKWSREEAAKFMMEGKGKTLDEQNTANAVVWYNTMFSGNNTLPNPDREQERVLREQQDFLKRHFWAMAVLGLQGGNQTTQVYKPLEEFENKDGTKINLATVSSGGGRLNYRSTDGAGDDFKNFLFFGSAKPVPLIEGEIGKQPRKKGEYSTAPVGMYDRVSTHNESFKDGQIREESNKTGEPAIGLSIPIGGVGQTLTDPNEKQVTTGYQGKSVTEAGKAYQTGAGLIRHKTAGLLSNTMVAFEGSAPHEDNILGGSHGKIATVKKVLKLAKSERTLTGQGKRSTWGISQKNARKDKKVQELTGNGSIKVDVTKNSLADLGKIWEAVEKLPAKKQQELYKGLLMSTTQGQRKALLNDFVGQNNTESSSETESVIDDRGAISKESREIFRQAYRADIRKEAYLTEGEGDIIAKKLGLHLNIYTELPPDFEREKNPGGGDCLLYALLQAKNREEGIGNI